jgi:hypothetical protein
MKYPVIVFAALCVIIGCKSNPAVEPDNNNNTPPTPLGTYTIVKAFSALPVLDNPVELTAPDDGTNRIFVVSQKGVISEFTNSADVSTKNVFLDISAKVTFSGEMGCWAWHLVLIIKPTGTFM